MDRDQPPDTPAGESSREEPGTGPENPEFSGTAAGGQARSRREHFIEMLADDDASARWKAAEALGRLGGTEAVSALIDTLWDDDARVRLKAVWALGEIGDMQAVPALRRLYRIEREEAREIIRDALDAINRQAGSGVRAGT